MAKAQIVNIVVLDNPSLFFNPFQFEITFECIEDLKDDLEWKIIYVGSAESEEYDQVLDTVFVGPVPEGRHMFVFQANSPDSSKIPVADAVGVTVVLLTCSYRNKEFVRVGYYVNNEYMNPELRENPPSVPQFDKLQRNILATDPRITKFKIDWGDDDDDNEEIGNSENNSIERCPTTTTTNGTYRTMMEKCGFIEPTNGGSISGGVFGDTITSAKNNNNVNNDINNSNCFISEDSIGPLNPVSLPQQQPQQLQDDNQMEM
ncbi:histone chaperone asf1 [Dermatophagoides pteronyssinus]|uniref:histone chaperone asf1 n=1 Tax=Dermatophagoides pteronyssinus TaxID=6956 RepID=UPI003F66639F